MRLVKQLFRHDPANGVWGDCARTVIACLCDVPAEEVPHWHEDLSGAEQSARHDAWLREREILRISIPVVADALGKALEWGAYYSRGMAYILAGRSRNDTNHVVICRGQEIIWDPAIDDSGVVGPCSDGYFWFEFLVLPLKGYPV
ncbi:hypothetical protein [Mesorhizobium sp. M0159]|uniref:hypothetical protein n=1 Tax=Mesorhizobium sp. M0159 TaxID=2956900 RepID=UPI003337C963